MRPKEFAEFFLIGDDKLVITLKDDVIDVQTANSKRLKSTTEIIYKLTVCLDVFKIDYSIDDKLIMTFNNDNRLLLNNDVTSSDLSNAFDFTAFSTTNVYGLPERLAPLSLRDTNDDEGYRLYNLDVYGQEPGSLQSLYGSIPTMHGVEERGKYMWTFLVDNPSEIWVDLKTRDSDKCTRWTTEGGIIEFYLICDYNFERQFYKQGMITGFAQMSPLFSFGYHQSRFGYLSQKELEEVDQGMDQYDIPYDVLWCDIDVFFSLI